MTILRSNSLGFHSALKVAAHDHSGNVNSGKIATLKMNQCPKIADGEVYNVVMREQKGETRENTTLAAAISNAPP
jgi:hypothetical protein